MPIIPILSVLFLLCIPKSAPAQGFLEEFSYDGLGFAGIGADIGGTASSRVTSEVSVGLRVDYGMFAPRVRVMLGASYFKGVLQDDEISEFERRLSRVVIDPTGDAIIDIGRITWTNLEATIDLQYLIPTGGRYTPYVALGVGVHVRNGSGPAIEGTFVEDALDTIAAGANGAAGIEIRLTDQVWFTAEARGGVSSELLLTSARGGLMYRFIQRGGQ